MSMEQNNPRVKKRRSYDASARRARAQRTRSTILEVARRRFLGEGYATTTVAAIAADAGVSVETIYKAFGGKPGLVRAIRDAASDPEMARLQVELDEHRLVRMSSNAQTLARGGHLRQGVTVEDAAELMWAYTAPELFELLVHKRRWTPERYGAFVADALIAALLPPEPPA